MLWSDSRKRLNKIIKILDNIFIKNDKLLNEGADVSKLEKQLDEINLKIANMQCLLGEILKK